MIRNKVILIAAGISLLGIGACRKQLDINENPNVAQQVTPALLLPTAQLEIASALGVDMNNNGSIWVQHWTQSASASQYKTLEQYQPTASTYDRVWTLLYSGALTDLQKMNQQAVTGNQKQYQAISKILTAYSYQLITDAWGDVPYSESLKGLPGDGGVLNPKFDAQESIYTGIIQMTKDGMALIDPSDPTSPGADDLIFGGDMDEWAVFGNTLLLRMYMRLSERSPATAQAGIAALYSNGIGFFGEGESAQIDYANASGNQNPLSSEVRRLGQNQVASATSADSLNSNGDARRTGFYNTTGTANVVGLRQGQTVAQTGVTYSIPNVLTGANSAATTTAGGATAAAAPVKFLTSYESLLLQAEAVARGWAAGSDSTLFARAVIENFKLYAVNTPATVLRDSFAGTPRSASTRFTLSPVYAAYRYLGRDTLTGFLGNNPVVRSQGAYWGRYPTSGSTQQKLRHIITQKWFCMNGNQGFEAWTEWRRTNYPDFLVISATSLIGNNFPARFFYPDVEFSRNSNFPGQKQITDKVWWDIN